jgi:hypothetical protein
MRSVQCRVDFGYQLSICSRTKENSENFDRSSRSQDLPGACRVLTSSPTFKYTNHKGSFCLCGFFIYNNVRICLTEIFIAFLD